MEESGLSRARFLFTNRIILIILFFLPIDTKNIRVVSGALRPSVLTGLHTSVLIPNRYVLYSRP